MKVRAFYMVLVIAASMSAYHANAAPPSAICAPIAKEGAALPQPVPTAHIAVTAICRNAWPKMHQACEAALTDGQDCGPCEHLVTFYNNNYCAGQ
jgi:hypothetical protein